MKIIETGDKQYTKVFDSREEAAREHEELHAKVDDLVAHLKHHGIHADGPRPGPAKEVAAPSTSVESIVPTKDPIPYAPLPRAPKVSHPTEKEFEPITHHDEDEEDEEEEEGA